MSILLVLIGLTVLLAGGVRALIAYASPYGRWSPANPGARVAALPLGVAANVSILFLTATVFTVPIGQSIRPMGWSLWVSVIAAGALGLGLPFAVADFARGRRRAAVLGFAVCLLPCPLAFNLFLLAVRLLDLRLAQ